MSQTDSIAVCLFVVSMAMKCIRLTKRTGLDWAGLGTGRFVHAGGEYQAAHGAERPTDTPMDLDNRTHARKTIFVVLF
jgi:hypothetical protein